MQSARTPPSRETAAPCGLDMAAFWMNPSSATGSSKTVGRASPMTAEFATSMVFSGGLAAPDPDDGHVVDADMDGAGDGQRRTVTRVEQNGPDAGPADPDGKSASIATPWRSGYRPGPRQTVPPPASITCLIASWIVSVPDLWDSTVTHASHPHPPPSPSHWHGAARPSGSPPARPCRQVHDREPAIVMVDAARRCLDQLIDRGVHGSSGEEPVVAERSDRPGQPTG